MCVCLHDIHVKECVGTEAGECWIGGGMARRLFVVPGIRGVLEAGCGRVCWSWLRWSLCFQGEVQRFVCSRIKIALCEAREVAGEVAEFGGNVLGMLFY